MSAAGDRRIATHERPRGTGHLPAFGALAGLLLCNSTLAACGYHSLRGDRICGRTHVAVRPFAEHSPLGLAPALAQQLNLALASGGLQLTANEEAADAILDGNLEVTTLPSATRAGVLTYQLGARAAVSLRERGGKELYAGTVAATEDYLPAPAGAQPQQTEGHRRAALYRLAERLADGIATQLALQGA